MKLWKVVALLLAVCIMCSLPLHAQQNVRSAPTSKTVATARVAAHDQLLRMEVGPYLRLIFPPETFSEDTAVTATLDVEKRRLMISSRGGEVSRTPAQIRLALPDLQGGLNVTYDHRYDDGSWLDGTVVDSDDEPLPQIVALMGDSLEPVVIDRSTVVLLSENKNRAQRIRWTDLAYGDRVRVRYGRGRRATSIEAIRVSGEGVVESLSGNRLRLVGAVSPFQISRRARFETVEGESFDPESLQPKDRIELRIDPQTREIWHITRVELAPAETPKLVVTHDGRAGLQAGDRVRITGTGASGGNLTIDIVNVESQIRAEELRNKPGTYVLTYTVPRGIMLDETPIVARLDLPNAPSVTVLAEEPLVFTASASGTEGGEGYYVAPEGSKPKPPVITSPEDGTRVRNTLKVDGAAAPHQMVRVTIDYVVTRSIVLLGEGRLLETEIKANSRGYFTTGEIPAEVQSLFGGDTDYRITVTALAANGTESDPAVVHVRRPD